MGAYQAPFFMVSAGAAVRAFSDAVNDRQTMLSCHPKDYILYLIGEFDDVAGDLKTIKPPTHLGHGSDFIEVKTGNSSMGDVDLTMTKEATNA